MYMKMLLMSRIETAQHPQYWRVDKCEKAEAQTDDMWMLVDSVVQNWGSSVFWVYYVCMYVWASFGSSEKRSNILYVC